MADIKLKPGEVYCDECRVAFTPKPKAVHTPEGGERIIIRCPNLHAFTVSSLTPQQVEDRAGLQAAREAWKANPSDQDLLMRYRYAQLKFERGLRRTDDKPHVHPDPI